MTSFKVLRNFTSIALTACCVIGVANAGGAQGVQSYILSDLGVIPAKKTDGVSITTPAAINENAQVAGTSGKSAFRYTRSKGVLEDVGGNPAGSTSRGFGINNSGQVVGDSTFGKYGTSHAALFSYGLTTDLGGSITRAGLFSRANGINAFGQVVGFSSETRDGNNSRAFILSIANRGVMIDLGTLGGSYAQALGINDSGFVTGNAQTNGRITTSPVSHAFIWHAKTGMLDLGTLGGDSSRGTSINAKNHIVGNSTINTFDDRVHAFLYHDEKMVDLGSLSGAAVDTDLSYALSVNSSDQVVGYSYLPSVPGSGSSEAVLGPWSVAFVYHNGLMSNLNDMIGTASQNYRLDSATAINDKGEIVALAFDTNADAFHAVLLTPNPILPVLQ